MCRFRCIIRLLFLCLLFISCVVATLFFFFCRVTCPCHILLPVVVSLCPLCPQVSVLGICCLLSILPPRNFLFLSCENKLFLGAPCLSPPSIHPPDPPASLHSGPPSCKAVTMNSPCDNCRLRITVLYKVSSSCPVKADQRRFISRGVQLGDV